jgi:polyhydroxybutyrate depolymerase
VRERRARLARWIGQVVASVVASLVATACVPMLGKRPASLAAAQPGGTTYHALRVGKAERTYLLHLPPVSTDSVRPLLLVFHGNHANASTVRKEANLEHATDPAGVVVAYLNGSGRFKSFNLTWNDGACCGWARSHDVDDGAFARALADTLANVAHVDRRRVYLAGLSAGGTVVLRIVCDGDTTFAGVVSVAGTMPQRACRPARRLPVMLMRGENDDELGRDHLENKEAGAPEYTTSFPASRAFWASHDGCASTVAVDSGAGAIITRATGCPPGLGVEDVVVRGQGHAWPGGKKPVFFAPKPANYDAASLIVDFFLRPGE